MFLNNKKLLNIIIFTCCLQIFSLPLLLSNSSNQSKEFATIYQQYLSNPANSFILLIQSFQRYSTNNQTLQEFVSFLEEKKNFELNNTLLSLLAKESKFNIILSIYFNKKNFNQFFKTHSTIYYQSLLSSNEEKKLLNILLVEISRKINLPINNEIFFLEKLVQSSKNPQQFIQLLNNLFNNHKLLKNNQSIKNMLKEIILFHSNNIKDLYFSMINNLSSKKNLSNIKTISSKIITNSLTSSVTNSLVTNQQISSIPKKVIRKRHQSLEKVYLTFQQNTLNMLYSNGYYYEYLSLYFALTKKNQDLFIQDEKKLQKAIYLTKNSHFFVKKFAEKSSSSTIFTLVNIRNKFYNNEYKSIISLIDKNYPEKKNITNKWYRLSLMKTKDWHLFTKTLEKEVPLLQLYLWENAIISENIKLLEKWEKETISFDQFSSLQIDFINLKNQTNDISLLVKIFKGILLQSKGFKSYILSIKSKISSIIFEYALTNYTYILLANGKLKDCNEMFRVYYHIFQHKNFKESLMFYHGMAVIQENQQEGKEILYKILYLNPESSYRFKIEQAIAKYL